MKDKRMGGMKLGNFSGIKKPPTELTKPSEPAPADGRGDAIANPSIQGLTQEDCETEVISEHVKLLINEGFLEGRFERDLSGGSHYVILGLTWEGHDFIDNAKNETVWKKVMADAEKKGMSLSMSVLNRLLTKAAQKYMGLT
jgi:hypothetical protein